MLEFLFTNINLDTGTKQVVNSEILQHIDKILEEVIKKRCELPKDMVLLHNNTTFHKSGLIYTLIRVFKWSVNYGTYLPDTVPLGFHTSQFQKAFRPLTLFHNNRRIEGCCYGVFCRFGRIVVCTWDGRAPYVVQWIPTKGWRLCWKIVKTVRIFQK